MKFKDFLKSSNDKLLILDFGSKKINELANMLRSLKIFCEVHPFTMSIEEIKKFNPKGIILSGTSVKDSLAGKVQEPAKEIYDLGVPILGICYGIEMLAKQLDGFVDHGKAEIGIVDVKIINYSKLLDGLGDSFKAWMHHRDQVTKLPSGFIATSSTLLTENASIEDPVKQIYGTQFHPEGYARDGIIILKNFINICGCSINLSHNFIDHFYVGGEHI
jgi:GMP synthase (glutamine-hydrolysing)